MNNDHGVNILDLFEPDIVDEQQLNIEQYGEVDYTKDNELIGHMKKSFVRVDSKAIKSFVKELQLNPNCGYVSYANAVIKEGFVPKKLSVMLKQGKGNQQRQLINGSHSSLEYRESIASKFLNYLGCPTCYNFVVNGKSGKYVASVDFISPNEKFYSFEDFDMRWSYNLDKMEKSVNEVLSKFEFNSTAEAAKNKQKFFNDLVYSMLVREALVADGDFHTGNFGFLYNEKEKTIKFINFDMEFLFLSSNFLVVFKNAISKIRKKYPEVYDKFMNHVRYIVDTFDKQKLRGIKDANTYNMYRTLIERAKALLRYDKSFNIQDKIKDFLQFNKKGNIENVR